MQQQLHVLGDHVAVLQLLRHIQLRGEAVQLQRRVPGERLPQPSPLFRHAALHVHCRERYRRLQRSERLLAREPELHELL